MLHEHDCVRFAERLYADGATIEAGTDGVVVHVHRDAMHVEVEVMLPASGSPRVITAPSRLLTVVPSRE